MYEVVISSKFKKDMKKAKKQGKDFSKLKIVLELLSNGKNVPLENKDHKLIGNWVEHRECHLESDWLLIYQINAEQKILELVRLGSHSDLF